MFSRDTKGQIRNHRERQKNEKIIIKFNDGRKNDGFVKVALAEIRYLNDPLRFLNHEIIFHPAS